MASGVAPRSQNAPVNSASPTNGMTLSKIRGQPSRKKTITCSHSIAISGDAWPDDARLSDIEERFTCRVCGKRGADVRPDEIRIGRHDRTSFWMVRPPDFWYDRKTKKSKPSGSEGVQ